MELSIIIPTFNEAANINTLIDKIKEISINLCNDFEIIVVDAGSKDNTFQIAKDKGIHVFIQKNPGYGGAIKEAIEHAKGKYIITIDADFSHNPYLIRRLYLHRNTAHILIASRYIRGGLARMPFSRYLLSVVLNKFLCLGLSLPLKDVTSGFRLYNAEIFKEIIFSERDFNALFEILIKAYINGFSVKEIPFHYMPRTKGRSHAKIIKFGLGFLRTFLKMWKIRSSILSADYDERAFYSRIPIQRFWQRQRYKIINSLTGSPASLLEAGCGSSIILGGFPQAVGLDINFNKLRYNLSWGNNLVNADIGDLCFKDNIFDAVICSEVIEHVKFDERIFQEFRRVLKKDGVLILGTPDYSRLSWILIEWLYKRLIPGGYAEEHITRYTRKNLFKILERNGFKQESFRYILGSELICKFRREI